MPGHSRKLLLVLYYFINPVSYDIPASLNVPLQKWLGSEYNYYQYQLNLLYSVYALPNIVLPLIGGVLIDRIGPARMLIVFSILVCLGQLLFSIGSQYKLFSLMVVGRLIFGLGGESLDVGQSRLTTDWFQNRGLALALGINISFARIATAINDIVSPWLADNFTVIHASYVGLGVCFISLMAAVWSSYLDQDKCRALAGVAMKMTDYEKRKSQTSEEARPLLPDASTSRDITNESTLQSTSPIRLEPIEDETVHLEQVRGLGPRFWLLCLVAILSYGAVVPFFHICSDYFQQKWYPNNGQIAGVIMSVPDIISAVGSPLCGILVDRVGRRASLMAISSGMIILTHILFGFTMITPFFTMSLMGVSYSIFAAALWPSIPHLVKNNQIATAYGIVTMCLNLSLFCFPILVAMVRNLHPLDYTYVEYLFIGLSILGTLCALLLKYVDGKMGSVLETSHHEPEEEKDLTVKVIAESILIPVPHTYITEES